MKIRETPAEGIELSANERLEARADFHAAARFLQHSTSRKLDEVALFEIQFVPEDSPVRRFYSEELADSDREPDDVEGRTFDRLREHLFCQFFSKRRSQEQNGKTTSAAVDDVERVFITQMKQTFHRSPEEIPETSIIMEIAQVHRLDPDLFTGRAATERNES